MIKLLASDLDGTIVNSNNQISPNNINVVNKLSNTQVNFAICTGKTYAMTKDICKKLKPTYGIFGNGTQIINLKTGEEINRNIINNEQAIKCMKIADENNLHVHIYTEQKIIVQQKLKYMALRNYKLYKDEVTFEIVESLKEYVKNQNPSILKLVISGEKDLKSIKEKLQEKENLCVIQIKKYDKYKDKVINQEYEYLDILPKQSTKYEAIKKLSNYLEISNQEIMTVGDNINDIEMIKNAGVGVAIGGSYKEVTSVASYVTKNDAENGGFAEAVYKFIGI